MLTRIEFDYQAEEKVFDRTFTILQRIGSDEVFAGPNTKFAVNIFEAWCLGLQRHLNNVDADDSDQIDRLSEALADLRNQNFFREVAVGGGLNYAGPLNKRITLAEEAIAKVL